MPKIVFWSPSVVSNGQTHASIAVSTLMAIEEDFKVEDETSTKDDEDQE